MAMTVEQVYGEWRDSLKSPDESIFYYHPDLERILLGFATFAITSPRLLQNLGKAEPLKIADFGFRILKLMDLYGIDIPPSVLNKHNGY